MPQFSDQHQQVVQDTISINLRIDGQSDGFSGICPQQREYEYLGGYLEGVQEFSLHVQAQARLLGHEGVALEGAVGEF